MDHLKLREAVESTAEVGLPLCLVIGILINFTTNHSPFLDQKKKTLLYSFAKCTLAYMECTHYTHYHTTMTLQCHTTVITALLSFKKNLDKNGIKAKSTLKLNSTNNCAYIHNIEWNVSLIIISQHHKPSTWWEICLMG